MQKNRVLEKYCLLMQGIGLINVIQVSQEGLAYKIRNATVGKSMTLSALIAPEGLLIKKTFKKVEKNSFYKKIGVQKSYCSQLA